MCGTAQNHLELKLGISSVTFHSSIKAESRTEQFPRNQTQSILTPVSQCCKTDKPQPATASQGESLKYWTEIKVLYKLNTEAAPQLAVFVYLSLTVKWGRRKSFSPLQPLCSALLDDISLLARVNNDDDDDAEDDNDNDTGDDDNDADDCNDDDN